MDKRLVEFCVSCGLVQLFPLLHKWGATGLLVEYEDMFPYTGDLADLAAPNAYRLSIRLCFHLSCTESCFFLPSFRPSFVYYLCQGGYVFIDVN